MSIIPVKYRKIGQNLHKKSDSVAPNGENLTKIYVTICIVSYKHKYQRLKANKLHTANNTALIIAVDRIAYYMGDEVHSRDGHMIEVNHENMPTIVITLVRTSSLYKTRIWQL